MESTEERVQELVDASLPSIASAIKEELKQTAIHSASHRLQELVSNEVSKWFQEHMAPEIHEVLAGEKSALVDAVRDQSQAVVDALTTTLQEALKENLQQSYKRRKIFEALFD